MPGTARRTPLRGLSRIIWSVTLCRTICEAFVPTTSGGSLNSFRCIRDKQSLVLLRASIGKYQYDRRPSNRKKDERPKVKSKETSSFWFSDPERKPLSEDQIVPCQQNLDMDGPLPFGAYRTIGNEEYYPKRTCLLSAGLGISRKGDEVDTEIAVSNAQKLIDSGLTTFQMNIPRSPKTESPGNQSGLAASSEQVWIEQNIYKNLVLDTPPSVLSLCNLSTKLSIPFYDFNGFGHGSMVRERVGQSILNIYGNTGGCLDSIQVDFRAGQNPNSASPYTFDVLDILFNMQREGFIRSINGVNFPVKVLQELNECDFGFDTNQISSSILNPNDFIEMQNCLSSLDDGKGRSMKVNMSRPLAGGLLTDKFLNVADQYRTRGGNVIPRYMSPSEKMEYERNLKGTWRSNYNQREGKRISHENLWVSYENTVMKTLQKISLKHRVDVASVALRWAMQQDSVGTISVGTSLNLKSDETFKLAQQLRKPFTLHLDEEDLYELLNISGKSKTLSLGENDEFDQIDFSNRNLWL